MLPTQAGNAVPFGVPTRFLLTGALALTTAATTLAVRPDLLLGSYGLPTVLAVVHILTLGFAAMTLVGALHQLLPVLLVTRLRSVALGTVVYATLLLGAASIVAGFALGYRIPLLVAGGSLVLAGMLLFDLNIWCTARAATSRDAVGGAMLASAAYLTLTVVMGLFLALSHVLPGLAAVLGFATPLHLGLGLFGAFFLAIAGASHKLLAMFVLSHGVPHGRLRIIVWLIHSAAALLALHTFLRLPTLVPAGIVVTAAVGLFLLDLRAVLAHRMRRQLEVPIRTFLLAPAFLVLALTLGLTGSYPAAVFSMLGGFVTLAIAGMLVKIAAFLTWQHRYAARIGKEKVPMLRDMTVAGLSQCTLWLLALGALALTLALAWPSTTLAAGGGMAMAAGSWALFAHLLWIVFARHRPQQAVVPGAMAEEAKRGYRHH